jgi:tetratricopeptide (TPR) repeat protein
MERRLRQVSGMEEVAQGSPVVGRVTQLVREAQALAKEGKIGRAERAYLEALKLDMRNVEAYRGLGLLYLSDRQYHQAKETFDFLVHFKSADGTVYAGLAVIAEADTNFEDAEKYRKLALESESTALRHAELGEYYLRREQGLLAMEQARLARSMDPESPRHLELLAESAILLRDRKSAESAYQTLRIKGCDRSTLQRLKEQLDAMEDEEEEENSPL